MSTPADKKIKTWQRAGAVVLALSVWQAASWAVGSALLLPGPVTVLGRLCALAVTAAFRRAVAFSFCRIAGGFALALVLAFVLVVVGAMVFLIGLVRYRTEMQHLNTANRVEALAALAGAGLFPLFTVLRFLHAYTRPGMAVFIVLLAVAVGLWVWRLAVDCKKLQAEKSHPIAEKD